MPDRVGYLGLGIMGAPMVRNLAKAGFPLVIFDVDRPRLEALAKEVGATAAASPAELAGQCDVMVACLPGADVVEAVVLGKDGVLENCRDGQAFVDLTTNYPPSSIKVAEALAAKGVGMLDAPVSGGSQGAIDGTLSIMVGGPGAVLERVRPVLEALGQRITHFGEQVGAGGHAKLTNQIMVSIHFAAIAEGLTYAAKAGLDLNKLVPALQAGWANSTVLGVKAPRILERDFRPVGTVAIQHKDLSYITRSMADMGIDLPFCKQIQSMYETLLEEGEAKTDQMALIKLFERAAGVEVKG